MFKKLVFIVLFSSSLLSSFSLWAEDNPPTVVAKLEVENQLSISALETGESKFINQIGTTKKQQVKPQEKIHISVVSAFWTMAFGLFFFVIRVTARRIK